MYIPSAGACPGLVCFRIHWSVRKDLESHCLSSAKVHWVVCCVKRHSQPVLDTQGVFSHPGPGFLFWFCFCGISPQRLRFDRSAGLTCECVTHSRDAALIGWSDDPLSLYWPVYHTWSKCCGQLDASRV
ncbi:hypothetical protein BaRGS_00025566 [Batillaria attramentaria]|uniref:Uncharacterized protein n=1 Tax=Batillaria attramentaria TaxID=370345 RepID=A0ABD0K7I6_9CAEN